MADGARVEIGERSDWPWYLVVFWARDDAAADDIFIFFDLENVELFALLRINT